MSNQEELTDVDAWKEQAQQDINLLKQRQEKIENDVNDLKINDKMQDKEISTLQATLSAIQDDTTWIRRKITGAIITAVITGLIGGSIALFFAKF